MKKIIYTIVILAGFMMQALAYDFQSGKLLYTIISTNPPQVSLVGHVDGTAAEGMLMIPEMVENDDISYAVTIIGAGAFRQCSHLTGTLSFPSTIVSIAAEAFYGCSGFTGDLVIPNSVTELSQGNPYINTVLGSFEDCTGFDGRLVLSDALQVIHGTNGGGCFAGCNNLHGELVFPNTLKVIGGMAFQGCSGFTGTLNLPDSLTYIGFCAFRDCDGFNGRLVIPDAVEWIGGEAFSFCDGIADVEWHHKVFYQHNFGDGVFKGCSGLAAINVPEGWTTTGKSTFSFCTNLKSVSLPESMTTIEDASFSHCQGLTEINIPKNVTRIEQSAFEFCSSLTQVTLPNRLQHLGMGAFDRCSSLLGRFVVPDLVEEIGFLTFNECGSVTRFVLGDSLKSINEAAFVKTNLESIMLKSVTPPELTRVTYQGWHLPEDMLIIVPCGTLEAYKHADGWSDFSNIQEGMTLQLSVVTDDENNGRADIMKQATCEDASVEVEAVPCNGCVFLYWEANGVRVSEDNPYNFVLVEDTELVARFSGTGMGEGLNVFSLFPNPARSELHLQFSPDVQPARIELYDLQGRLVCSSDNGLEILNLQGLAAGQYVMKVTLDNGKVFTDKVVKE